MKQVINGKLFGDASLLEAVRADLEDFAQVGLIWTDSVRSKTKDVRISLLAREGNPAVNLWRSYCPDPIRVPTLNVSLAGNNHSVSSDGNVPASSVVATLASSTRRIEHC